MNQTTSHRTPLILLLLGILAFSFPAPVLSQSLFTRGDCNTDDLVNIADAILGLGILFAGDGPANCEDACDTNDDGSMDISDPIYLLATLFSAGPNPPAPNSCGDDPTPDSLSCLTGPVSCGPPTEDCSNGVDDDGDNLIDCQDSDCIGDPACVETDCENGADDDNDGQTDCLDTDCLNDPSCAAAPSFEFDVYPLFVVECNFCHGPPAPFGNLDFTTGGPSAAYSEIVNAPSGECANYDLVEPGESANSWLYRKVEGTHETAASAVGCDLITAGTQMPLGPFCCLEPSEIELIRNWIDSGAEP